jgi:hypothetical protein
MTTDELGKLKQATNDAIGVMQPSGFSDEAINWGDLGCVESSYVLNDSGENYCEVLIEEAAPDCAEFQAAIQLELGKRGWPYVRVRTEW